MKGPLPQQEGEMLPGCSGLQSTTLFSVPVAQKMSEVSLPSDKDPKGWIIFRCSSLLSVTYV